MTKLQKFNLLVLLPALLASCGGGLGTSSTSSNVQLQPPALQTPVTTPSPYTPTTQIPVTTPVTTPDTQTPATAPVTIPTTPIITPATPVTQTPVTATPVTTPVTTPATPTTPVTTPISGYSVSPSPATQKLLDLTNAARAAGAQCSGENSGGNYPTAYFPPAAPLVWNGYLGGSAVKFSIELAQVGGPLSHIGANGSTMTSRDEAAGYVNWNAIAENLAKGYGDSDSDIQAVVHAWLASTTGHCHNMMSSDYKEFGAGYTNGYWVEEFGTTF